jgi:hypothetical protein
MIDDGRAAEAGDLRVRLEVLAWTAARHGNDDLAAHLFGAVEAAWDAVGASGPRIDLRHYDQARAAVRSRLGEAHYGVAWEEGYRLSPEQVVSRLTTTSRRSCRDCEALRLAQP